MVTNLRAFLQISYLNQGKLQKLPFGTFVTVVTKSNFSYQLSKLNICDVIFYRMRDLES